MFVQTVAAFKRGNTCIGGAIKYLAPIRMHTSFVSIHALNFKNELGFSYSIYSKSFNTL